MEKEGFDGGALGRGAEGALPDVKPNPGPTGGTRDCLRSSEGGCPSAVVWRACQGPVPCIMGMFVFGKRFRFCCWGFQGMRISSPGKGINPRPFLCQQAQRRAAPSVARLCFFAQRLSLIQANGTKADYLTFK